MILNPNCSESVARFENLDDKQKRLLKNYFDQNKDELESNYNEYDIFGIKITEATFQRGSFEQVEDFANDIGAEMIGMDEGSDIDDESILVNIEKLGRNERMEMVKLFEMLRQFSEQEHEKTLEADILATKLKLNQSERRKLTKDWFDYSFDGFYKKIVKVEFNDLGMFMRLMKKNFSRYDKIQATKPFAASVLQPNCSEFAGRFVVGEYSKEMLEDIKEAVAMFHEGRYDPKKLFPDEAELYIDEDTGKPYKFDIFTNLIKLPSGKEILEVSGNSGDHGTFFDTWLEENGIPISDGDPDGTDIAQFEFCIETENPEYISKVIERLEELKEMAASSGIERDILVTKIKITNEELDNITEDVYFNDTIHGVFLQEIDIEPVKKYLKKTLPFYDKLKIGDLYVN